MRHSTNTELLRRFATHLGTISTKEIKVGSIENDDDCSCSSSSTDPMIDDLLDSLPSFGEHTPKTNELPHKKNGYMHNSNLIGNSNMHGIETNPEAIDSNRLNSQSNMNDCEYGSHSSAKALCNMLASKDNGGSTCSFPSFSISTHRHDHDGCTPLSCSRKNKRRQLEHAAASQLSRFLLVDSTDGEELNRSESSDLVEKVGDVSEIPSRLLACLSESFLSLIDARLRAYAMVLLRHSLTTSSNCQQAQSQTELDISSDDIHDDHSRELNKKLLALVDIGKNISIETIVTAFCTNTNESKPKHSENKNKNIKEHEAVAEREGENLTTLPLFFDAVMDVTVPYFIGTVTDTISDPIVLTVSVSAPGKISGTFIDGPNPLLRGVNVQLDTHILLDSMIEKARCVALQAVNNLNVSTGSPASYSCPITAHEEERTQITKNDQAAERLKTEGGNDRIQENTETKIFCPPPIRSSDYWRAGLDAHGDPSIKTFAKTHASYSTDTYQKVVVSPELGPVANPLTLPHKYLPRI
eukprot:CAMPEP_0195529882 /NCGR_PEP_ID=MMETSP0794_2-20130614/32524_1 /TAXON_ID=515487 /ORGANISM="Stephanopyxis turris, Strain CCMP 815" /LENGTH=525 /DNA_ID=CAMNT_0040661257 /DNA_START=52 /DNA_END=1629 /DNA_ORIENTATION=-